ncbi:MAG: ABC transporter substrate-binding protein [Cyanobacteria bacterium J06639_1]
MTRLPVVQLSRRQFIGICGGAAIALASCRPPSDTQGAVEVGSGAAADNRIRMGITDKLRTLDPADAYEPASLNVLLNVGETLYTYPPGSKDLTPLLATDMPVIDGEGTTFRIPLREGVKFHDGTDFNAEAMAFSLRRLIENGGKPSFLLADIVDSVEATGEYELTVKLKYPFGGFSAMLAFPGACAVSPAAYTIGSGEFEPEKVVATGPYRLTRYMENVSVTLDANPDYWGDTPANEGVDLQLFNTSGTLLNAFKTGAIDLAFQTLEPSQIDSLKKESDAGWQLVSQSSGLIRYLVLNVTQAPLDRKEVRQAIAAAVDRAILQNRVFLGQAEPLYSLVPNNLSTSRPAFKDAYGEGDTDKAKELLSAAGFSADNPARTTLWHASENTRGELMSSLLKASLEKAFEGALEVDLQAVEAATLFDNLNKGTYPMVLLSWSPDFLDADNYIQPFLPCENHEDGVCVGGETFEHGSFFHSDDLNQLVQQQRTETDVAKREQILADIQAAVAEEVPYIPLVQGIDFISGSPKVQNLKLAGQQAVPLWLVRKA